MRTLDELVNAIEPALPLVKQWAEDGGLQFEFLPPHVESDNVLFNLQVSTRSPLGAIAHGTGGILVDDGWLRMLGSGHPNLTRDLVAWNHGRSDQFLLVADDAIGGFFAINGGGLGEDKGAMYYLGPDTLGWEAMGVGHTEFVQWAFTDKLHAFYENLRWTGWEEDVRGLSGDMCFNFYPFLWSEQGSVEDSKRRPVPIAEQYLFNIECVGRRDS